MLYATDKEGVRRRPKETGDRATCSGCASEMIAKCGEIVTHHWSHRVSTDCVAKGETEWHRYWKLHLTSEWCEVPFRQNGKVVHIADICFRDGFVLELQHSSISRKVIQERESFYKRGAWLFDGETFTKETWAGLYYKVPFCCSWPVFVHVGNCVVMVDEFRRPIKECSMSVEETIQRISDHTFPGWIERCLEKRREDEERKQRAREVKKAERKRQLEERVVHLREHIKKLAHIVEEEIPRNYGPVWQRFDWLCEAMLIHPEIRGWTEEVGLDEFRQVVRKWITAEEIKKHRLPKSTANRLVWKAQNLSVRSGLKLISVVVKPGGFCFEVEGNLEQKENFSQNMQIETGGLKVEVR